MTNLPTRTQWIVTAWQQKNNVGCHACDTQEEAAVWMRKWQAEGYRVVIRRVIEVVQ